MDGTCMHILSFSVLNLKFSGGAGRGASDSVKPRVPLIKTN
jgi:hypothetical protein